MGIVEKFPVPKPIGGTERVANPESILHTTSTVEVRNTQGIVIQTISVEEYSPSKENQKSARPVLVVPGYTEGPRTLEENQRETALLGRKAFTFDAQRGISNGGGDPADLLRLKREGFHEYEIKKAQALLKVVEQKVPGRRSVDAIGHSEGCIYLVLAALANPVPFHTLLLVNPGGMVGQDNFFSLIDRAYKHSKKEREMIQRNPDLKKVHDIGKSERVKNLTQSIMTGISAPRAIACTQIRELLVLLKEKGVRIVIAHSVDDEIFPMDEVRKMSAEGIDGFYSINMNLGHNGYFLDPQTHAFLAEHTFSGIEKREERETAEKQGFPTSEERLAA